MENRFDAAQTKRLRKAIKKGTRSKESVLEYIVKYDTDIVEKARSVGITEQEVKEYLDEQKNR